MSEPSGAAPTLRIRALDISGSVVDGPGLRSVLYLQGCDRRCVGCHNSETWDLDGGVPVAVATLAADLKHRVRGRKLTISGGEPLLQTASLLALLRLLPDFDVALYTGHELSEVDAELLGHLRYVKVGPYRNAERTTTIPFVGSRNQRLIRLRETP